MHAENCFRRQLGRISSYFEWKVLARLQNGYMLAKKRKGVKVEVVSSPRGNKLAQSDIDKFNAQYSVPGPTQLSIRSTSFFALLLSFSTSEHASHNCPS